MIPVAEKRANKELYLKAPIIIKNSPTKPLVPGKPTEANTNDQSWSSFSSPFFECRSNL